MPTYSYLCGKCEKKFDAFHSMHCTDPQLCPVCGERGKKLLSAGSIIFRGTGFYSTDYRDSGYIEAQKRDNSEPSNGGKETAKPAAAPSAPSVPASGDTSEKKSTAPQKEPSSSGSSGSSCGSKAPAKSAASNAAPARSD